MASLRLVALLLALGLGLWLAWRSGGKSQTTSAKAPPPEAAAAPGPEASPVELRAPNLQLEPGPGRDRVAPDDPQAEAEVFGEPVPEDPQSPRPRAPLWAALFEPGADEADGPGLRWNLGAGLTTAGVDFPNDRAGVALVPPGVTLTLYEHGAGEGRRVVLLEGRHDLEPLGFAGQVSSARVEPAGPRTQDPATPMGPPDAPQLFEHLPREGETGQAWTLRLPPGSSGPRLFRASQGTFDDNAASALWVPPGFEVTLTEGSDGRGRALVLGPGLHELAPYGFNDKTSAARVRRTDDGR